MELSKEERINKINTADKLVREAEGIRAASIAMKEQYEKDREESENELLKLGTNKDEAENKLKELDLEMNALLETIEKEMPVELLKKYGKM